MIQLLIYTLDAKLMLTAQCSHYTESLPLEGKVSSKRETDEV